MNAPVQFSRDVEADQSTSFYRLRSDILDIFADIEQAILAYIHDHGGKVVCSTAPLGHKIEAAKSVKAGPQRSRQLKANADFHLDQVVSVLPTRASIVHSRIELVAANSGKMLAVFRISKDTKSENYTALVFGQPELTDFQHKLEKMSESLAAALVAQNPAPKTKA